MKILSKTLGNLAVLLAGIGVSWSCASTYALQTKPSGTKVYDGDQLLGETPLQLKSSQISQLNGGGVMLRLEREGYKRLWVWLPVSGRDHTVSLVLTPFYQRVGTENSVEDQPVDRTDLYRLSDQLLNIQAGLLLGAGGDDKSLGPMLDANPTLGSLHFLKGLAQLRAGKTPDSLPHLRDAVRLAPGESDFLSLYNEITRKDAVVP